MILKDKQMRYDRQIILPEVGEEGQKKLQEAKVLIVGVGGLGSPSPSTWQVLAWDAWGW